MTNTFFISDMHFGHTNAWQLFKRNDGTPLRPFTSTEEMDGTMIKNWNAKIGDKDRVYVLGDVAMRRQSLQVLHQLRGRLYIVLGNHDPWKKKDWDQFHNVDQLAGVRMFPDLGWVCTHIPVHERQLQGRWTHNIHGHLHYNKVMKSPHHVDERYFNVSVECIDYTPIELEELKKLLDD